MGELKVGLGQDIEIISCDGIGGAEVIETNEDGELEQTMMGLAIQINDKNKILPHAPEGCPLLKAAELRAVGDFVVCASCSYSTLASDGMVEC